MPARNPGANKTALAHLDQTRAEQSTSFRNQDDVATSADEPYWPGKKKDRGSKVKTWHMMPDAGAAAGVLSIGVVHEHPYEKLRCRQIRK